MARTLLIDADILAYEIAASTEQVLEIDEGYYQTFCDFKEVKRGILERIEYLTEEYDADNVKLALTDSIGNFRKSIYPNYKSRRSSVKKPIVLKHTREWLINERGAYWRPGLEGDDILGILATHESLVRGERVIFSVDKDLRQIPGLHATDGDVVEITEDQAYRFFMVQTLTGDSTDGYPGLPGYGPKKAESWLDQAVKVPTKENLWRAVVDAYVRAGFTEEDALVQARCARILTADLYDFKNKEPILWTPKAADH